MMQRLQRFLPWLLALSLLLNLLFLGFFLGRKLPHRMKHQGPPFHPSLAKKLSPQGGELATKTFRTMRKEHRAMRKELRQHKKKVLKALRAEPFDPQVLEERFQEASLITQRHRSSRHQLLSQLLSQLSAKDRKILAEHLNRHDPELSPQGPPPKRHKP